MPKISDKPMTPIQVRLFDEDLEFLRKLYGQNFGVNKAIRTIIATFVKQSRAKADMTIDKMEVRATEIVADMTAEAAEATINQIL